MEENPLARQGKHGQRGWVILLSLLLFTLTCSTQAEEASRVKAAFVFNFTKFVTWPADVEAKGGELRLCLSSRNPLQDSLMQLNGRKVRSFMLSITVPDSPREFEHCHIVLLTDDPHDLKALAAVATLPVLTIAEHHGFARRGSGAIELFTENNLVRFDVNLQRIKSSGLDINSTVLELAREVY